MAEKAFENIKTFYQAEMNNYRGKITGEGSLALTGVGVCMPIIMIT